MSPRVVIAHDYLTQRGGAERVVLSLCEAFPEAPVVTSVYHPEGTFGAFRDVDIRTSWLQRVPVVRRDPRLALPLLPKTWAGLHIDDADVVVASSTGFAHGVTTEAPKIVYCHNPPRWLYQRHHYLGGQLRLADHGLRGLSPYLQRWDKRAAASAAAYLVNSSVVAERVRAAYGIEASILHPPTNLRPDDPLRPVSGLQPGFYLLVGRKRGYKNTAVACEAVERLPGRRLVCVGGLPRRTGRRHWSDRITGVSDIPDAELRWLYANCTGLIAPAHEDFGLTPVEAAAFGKPTVALEAGGYLDSVVDGRTGVFAAEPSADAFADAIQRLERQVFDPVAIDDSARRFSMSRFVERIRREVATVLPGGAPSPNRV